MMPRLGYAELAIIAAIICCPIGLLAGVAGLVVFLVQKGKKDKLEGSQ